MGNCSELCSLSSGGNDQNIPTIPQRQREINTTSGTLSRVINKTTYCFQNRRRKSLRRVEAWQDLKFPIQANTDKSIAPSDKPVSRLFFVQFKHVLEIIMQTHNNQTRQTTPICPNIRISYKPAGQHSQVKVLSLFPSHAVTTIRNKKVF